MIVVSPARSFLTSAEMVFSKSAAALSAYLSCSTLSVSKPTVRTTPTATATAVPTVAPTLVPLPTVTPGGQALLASVRSDMAAQWVKNTSETALRAGPSDDAAAFTVLPQWTILRQTDARPDWLAVYYSGDGETRQPGPGWGTV